MLSTRSNEAVDEAEAVTNPSSGSAVATAEPDAYVLLSEQEAIDSENTQDKEPATLDPEPRELDPEESP
ncbi:MAG: hypothetical protein KDB68_01225, partial [Planctomycetes bacterium]|nr:hypothetical protein [Planctomycetota bacterium]